MNILVEALSVSSPYSLFLSLTIMVNEENNEKSLPLIQETSPCIGWERDPSHIETLQAHFIIGLRWATAYDNKTSDISPNSPNY